MTTDTKAILAMALGGPTSLDDVGPYLADIRRGRPTPPAMVEEFRERYRRIGGGSPLLEISTAQAKGLEAALVSEGLPVRAYVGMRHWHPFIAEALAHITADGIRKAVALCLTPYYSRLSVGGYLDAARQAIKDQGLDLELAAVESWNDAPGLAEAFAEKVAAGRAALEREGFRDPYVLFTAHSLPRTVIEAGDPYERELRETMEAIKALLPPIRSSMAYQSAGRTADPWLGPPLEQVIEDIRREGEKAVLVVPFGFVSDHLEILYDVDIEAKEKAEKAGVRLERGRDLARDEREHLLEVERRVDGLDRLGQQLQMSLALLHLVYLAVGRPD